MARRPATRRRKFTCHHAQDAGARGRFGSPRDWPRLGLAPARDGIKLKEVEPAGWMDEADMLAGAGWQARGGRRRASDK